MPVIRVTHVPVQTTPRLRSRVRGLVLFLMELAPIPVLPRNVMVSIPVVPVVHRGSVHVPGVPVMVSVPAGR